MDVQLSKNFTQQELQCSCCGKCVMHPQMVSILQQMRDAYGRPIFISSGYRCTSHPVESMKEKPGEHTHGMAVDIICNGKEALELLNLAHQYGVRRIGVNQKGRASGRFIHIGIADRYLPEFPGNAIWTY